MMMGRRHLSRETKMNPRPPSFYEAAEIPLLSGDTSAKVVTAVPVSCFNPLDSGWPYELRSQILETKYRDVTLQDAMVTGNTWTNEPALSICAPT